MKTLDSNLRQLRELGQSNLLSRCFRLGRRLFFRSAAFPAFFVLASTAQAALVTISWSGWVTDTSAGFGAVGSEVFETLTYDTASPNLNTYGTSYPDYYSGTAYSIQSGATTITNSGPFTIVIGTNGNFVATDAIYFDQNNGSYTGGNVLVNGVATTDGVRNRLWDTSGTLLNNYTQSLPTSLPALPGLVANVPAGSTFSGDLYTTGYGTLLFAWDSAAPHIDSPVPDDTGAGTLIIALIGVVGVARFKRIYART